MLSFLPPPVRGALAALLLALNTLFWCTLLFALSLVKLVLPARAVRVRIDPWLNTIATLWIACNSGWMRLTQRDRVRDHATDACGWPAVHLHCEGRACGCKLYGGVRSKCKHHQGLCSQRRWCCCYPAG